MVKRGRQNQKYIFFFLPVMLFIHLDCFGLSSRVLEVLAVEICLLSNIMELDFTWLVVLKAPKTNFENLNSNVSFQKS